MALDDIQKISYDKCKQCLGKMYSIQGEYASIGALSNKSILDEAALGDVELINFLSINQSSAASSSLLTRSQLAKTLSSEISIEGSYGFFSAEVESTFRKSINNNESEEAYSHYFRIDTGQASLDVELCKEYINSDLLSDLNNEQKEPKGVLEKYGTHFLSSLVVGASIKLDIIISEGSEDANQALKLKLDAGYGSIFKTSGAVSTDIDQATASKMASHDLKKKGGSEALAFSFKDALTQEELTKWEQSARAYPEFIAFKGSAPGDRPLTPIWIFCKSDDRKKLFQDAFNLMYKKDPGPVEEETIPYEITITTSSDSNAGADSQIKYYIEGTKGFCEWQIPSMEKGEFKKGQTFKTTRQFRDLGKITHVRLTQEPGKKDGWKVDQVIVKGGKPEEEVKFTLNNGWLKDFDDDEKIYHDRIFDRTGSGVPIRRS